MFRFALSFSLALIVASCGDSSTNEQTCGPWSGPDAGLGAVIDQGDCRISFRVFSERATRIEVWIYDQAIGPVSLSRALEREGSSDIFAVELTRFELEAAGVSGAIHYGYRAWGPNWTYDQEWRPGTSRGLLEDVDSEGNRFNPNKLVLDPYAREQSHDPRSPMSDFATGPDYRDIDTGSFAPKGLVLVSAPDQSWERPQIEPGGDFIYEVHVRGLTKNDSSIDPDLRGTYAGAALKAGYLRALGVTAVEFLPVHETTNQYNGEVEGQGGDNYWGYASLSFFAPERRYAADQSPGGPTREFREMVRAFHAEGIKVYIDVVYNHTAETGTWDRDGRTTLLLSWRGLDNASYYQLNEDGRGFRNDNGVGPNIGAVHPRISDMVMDSLNYWHREMGVDGYRFDLAPVLGNQCETGCFRFETGEESLIGRIGAELPEVALLAEPWTATSYHFGDFPAPWNEWNDNFRDVVRKHINKEGVEPVTLRELTTRLSGSPDRFADDGRSPLHSVNFVVAHDGFTLADLFSCNEKNNDQPWPYGPSPGGSDNNNSWDHGGDPLAQREAARTALALMLVSPGVPMITGGDEFLRSQRCNNNVFNLDNDANWLDWQATAEPTRAAFSAFVTDMVALRAEHASLRPVSYWTNTDGNNNGLADAVWLTEDGAVLSDAILDDPNRRFVALLLDGTETGDTAAAIYVAYNGATNAVTTTLPAVDSASWELVVDTSRNREATGNSGLAISIEGSYGVAPRSLAVFIAR